MSIPSVLMNNVTNESQDLTINTEVLEPNSLNAVQAVFVLPKKGSVLDSKSALKFRIDWSGYAAGTTTDVGGKLFSGVLGAIKNARLYASGQLISDLRHAGEKIHLDNQWKSQEYREEYIDVKTSSASGFAVAEDIAESGVNGAICSTDRFDTRTAASAAVCHDKPYFRGIGNMTTDKNGLESFLLLEELFPMLRDIQLPLRFLKDEIRIEIDWEQDKTNWLYVGGTAVTDGLASVTISEAVLFLDYITYSPEVDSSLEATLATSGVSIPFRQTAVITKTLPAATGAGTISEDILMGQEGRAIMKVYCAKKYANAVTDTVGGVGVGGTGNPAFTLQGDCRSDRLTGEKFNLVVNDLLILDRDCENVHEAYALFSEAGEGAATTYPNAWEENTSYVGGNMPISATTDVLYNTNGANNADQKILSHAPAIKGIVEAGIWGTQNWIGFNIGQGYGRGLNPANAMRIGATPLRLRIERTADGANAAQKINSPVQIVCFVEYLRLFDLRDGEVAVRDL